MMNASRATLLIALALSTLASAQTTIVSHPPLRTDLPLPKREVVANALHVDVAKGNDANAGTADAPFRTINHALTRIAPGQTLYLHAGVYYENVYLSAAGTAEAPIVLASYPGEKAVIDGGIPEFFQQPAAAWEPLTDGAPGEYRSARTYRNIHLPVGSFGDSMLGLQTYYHAIDLRTTQQRVHYSDYEKRKEIDHDALYCGPGLWYDQATGYLYARLAHTDLEKHPNYKGETDPRKVPLVIAPFRSVPLTLDGARHVIVRDLVIRGGYDAVKLFLCQNLTFDRVTIWAGTYGISAFGTQKFTMTDSAIFGSIAPWTFRSDGSKRDYPGRPNRNITRLNSHALIVIEAGREFSVYATPVNDDWNIEHCLFAEAHDGLYLGGINLRFANNFLDNLQDDGIYLSQMYPRHFYMRGGATLDICGNLFRQVNMPFAFGGTEDTKDTLYIHRNVIDNRRPLNFIRPSDQSPDSEPLRGMVMSDHGSPPWPTMYIYHNTFVCAGHQREAHMRLLSAVVGKSSRRVFNNLLIHLGGAPAYPAKIDPDLDVQVDANLFWGPDLDSEKAAAYFNKFRAGADFEKSKKVYPAGFSSHSLAADPRFLKCSIEAEVDNDYRLGDASPAINAGVPLPPEWPDPVREKDAGAPDIGAFPAGAQPLSVGPRPLP